MVPQSPIGLTNAEIGALCRILGHATWLAEIVSLLSMPSANIPPHVYFKRLWQPCMHIQTTPPSIILENWGKVISFKIGIGSVQCNFFLFFDYSVTVVTAASEVLKEVLSTRKGYEFASDYKTNVQDSQLFHYLNPFKPHKKKVHFFASDTIYFLN